MPDTVNFTLVDVLCFCVPINTLGVCSGAQFNYLKTVCSLPRQSQALIGGTREAFSSGLFYPLLRQSLMNYEDFPLWLVGIQTIPNPVGSRDYSPCSFEGSSPASRSFLTTHVLISIPLKSLKGPPGALWSFSLPSSPHTLGEEYLED